MPKFGTFKFGQEKFGSKPPRYAHLPTYSQQVLGAQARKQLKKEIIYRIKNNRQQQYKYFIPTNPQTGPQQAHRQEYTDAYTLWQGLTPAQKDTWRKKALGSGISGYNLFMKEQMLS
ncbi:hypothetical protein ES703_30977 [subsurface metagenome]|jgi:IS1 family transposase